MNGLTGRLQQLSFGEIVVGPEKKDSRRHPAMPQPLSGIARTYTWRPPQWAREQSPPGFILPLQCVTGPDGLRRIYPGKSWEGFLEYASAGGFAILCERQNLDVEQRFSYRLMRFLFRRARRMAEFFAQSFRHSRDLFIVRSARTDPTEMDILPPDLGLDARDQGERWSVSELTRRGEDAARAAGWTKPTHEKRIHYGLLEAARLRPLAIPLGKASLLVRSALFDVSPTFDEMDPDLITIVTERTADALERHMEDDADGFDRWFGGPNSSFVHQIAKKKRSPGGALEEDLVREVLLYLGWQAYEFMANCLHAQMRTVQNALPVTLTERERLIFEQTYLPQPYLGDLPLVLLIERFGFLRGILAEMWDQLPNTSLAPVLHRLLDNYSVMAVRRREVDRLRKSGRPRPLVEGVYRVSVQDDPFQELAAAIRELRGIGCRCGRPEWRAEIRGKPKNMVTIAHTCMSCDQTAETRVSREELAQLGPCATEARAGKARPRR